MAPALENTVQLGKLSVSADGREVSLNVGADPFFAQSTFTLLIYLAGSFASKLVNIKQNGTKALELRYENDAQLLIDLDDARDSDIEYYKFRWSKPVNLTHLWDSLHLGSIDEAKWYGGPLLNNLRFPIRHEKPAVYNMSAFVTGDIMHVSASGQDRHWLCSRKIALHVPWNVPLWTSLRDGKLTLKSSTKMDPEDASWAAIETQDYNTVWTPSLKPRGSPYFSQANFLEYEFAVPKNPANPMTLRQFHLKTAKRYLDVPIHTPDKFLVEKPIWTTWAVYWTAINESVVMDYVDKIVSNNLPISQLELDDMWTTAYGDFEIDTKKFPNFSEMVEKMKKAGVPRLTAWVSHLLAILKTLRVHPFINGESTNGRDLTLRKYFVHDVNGNVTKGKWWNGFGYVTDFTNPDAAQWFGDNLRRLQKSGIYTYKFDAGEINWMPPNFVLHNGMQPNDYSKVYADFVTAFGGAVENRYGAKSQKASVFLRTMDRFSCWDEDGGLSTVIPWMLHLSLHGYFWNLPDMIGGNAYSPTPGVHAVPNKELFIRWTQVNTFMMAMQFSYAPFHYDSEAIDITKKMLALREKWLLYMLKCIDRSVEMGEPPFRPMWWNSDASEAYKSENQFMVGDILLVAPVVEEGATSRNVFLPEGKWKCGNTDKVYDGLQMIEVKAPLDTLPHFEKLV